MIEPQYLINQVMIAKRFRLTAVQISNWRVRYSELTDAYPEPLDTPLVTNVPLWDVRVIDQWMWTIKGLRPTPIVSEEETEMPNTELTRPELVELASSLAVTLDGHRATIGGTRNPFATVHTIGSPSYGVEFAWPTVERILTRTNNPGAFKS